MMKVKAETDGMRKKYHRKDLGAGIRGKFHAQCRKGHNLVLLTPAVAEAFPTDEAVNDALLGLVRLARATQLPPRRSGARSVKSTARRPARAITPAKSPD